MDSKKIKNLFEEKWFIKLQPFIESKEFDLIIEYLKQRKSNGVQIFPHDIDCFNAFKYCPYDKMKIIILGQDPYHDVVLNKPVAHGLSFSYNRTNESDLYIPPSLRNVLKEVERDIYTVDEVSNGHFNLLDTNLERWAKQGVLLLNTALTVEESSPNSHVTLWRPFIQYVFNLLNDYNSGLVFMLWGKNAEMYEDMIFPTHYVLKAGHPSPLNTKNPFIGCGHFSEANKIIEKNNGKNFIINW